MHWGLFLFCPFSPTITSWLAGWLACVEFFFFGKLIIWSGTMFYNDLGVTFPIFGHTTTISGRIE
jgi:hypothetical protein